MNNARAYAGFYCACERALDPSLVGLPMAVVQYNPYEAGRNEREFVRVARLAESREGGIGLTCRSVEGGKDEGSLEPSTQRVPADAVRVKLTLAQPSPTPPGNGIVCVASVRFVAQSISCATSSTRRSARAKK